MNPFLTKTIVLLFCVLCPIAYASGGVSCLDEKGNGISWGTGHVTGSGRISPYEVKLRNQQILINDADDSDLLRRKTGAGSQTKQVIAREVGYWKHGNKILVHLADDQVSETWLLLGVKRQKKSVDFKGTLELAKPIVDEPIKLKVTCVTE